MESRIVVGEFRGKPLYSECGYPHLFSGEWGSILVVVPTTRDYSGPETRITIDPEGPITCGKGLGEKAQVPVTPEEEAYLRPIFRDHPPRMAAYAAFAAARTAAKVERLRAAREALSATPGHENADDRRGRIDARVALAETVAMLDAERTPLAVPVGDRNPGGRCPECGYSHGHRMDCCMF